MTSEKKTRHGKNLICSALIKYDWYLIIFKLNRIGKVFFFYLFFQNKAEKLKYVSETIRDKAMIKTHAWVLSE